MYDYLILTNEFNKELEKNEFSELLSVLMFNDEFNRQIKKNILPAKLSVLIFGYDFNRDIDNDVLPNNLKMLELGWCYNAKIEDCALPEKLEILIINYQTFNSLITLPKSLTYLEILDAGNSGPFEVNQIFYELISDFLEYLVLNSSVITFKNTNTRVENYGILLQEKLQNLKYLSIDGTTKQLNILNNLPINLSVIKFTGLNAQLSNLPMNLKEMYLSRKSDKKYIKKIPFGCDTIIYKDDTDIRENYLEILTHKSSSYSDSIFNNILRLDK